VEKNHHWGGRYGPGGSTAQNWKENKEEKKKKKNGGAKEKIG